MKASGGAYGEARTHHDSDGSVKNAQSCVAFGSDCSFSFKNDTLKLLSFECEPYIFMKVFKSSKKVYSSLYA